MFDSFRNQASDAFMNGLFIYSLKKKHSKTNSVMKHHTCCLETTLSYYSVILFLLF